MSGPNDWVNDFDWDAPEPDYYQINIPLAGPQMTAEAYAAQKEIPGRYYSKEWQCGRYSPAAMRYTAQAISQKYPTVPVAIEAIWGTREHDTNAFNAEEFQEVRRFLAGVEALVPDDDKKQM